MKKRIFAGALALLMIIGLLPVSSMVKKPMEVKAEDKVYSIPDVQSGTSYKDGAVRFDLSRCFSAKHYISENSVQNIRRADNPQRLRIIGSKVLFYL